MRISIITTLLFLMISPWVLAQEDVEENLSQQAANPLANLISLPFQNNLNMNYGEFNRNTNILNIQPVVPLANGRIITRTIFPIVSIPDFGPEWQWRIQAQVLLPRSILFKK
jgi:hypothetical protein